LQRFHDNCAANQTKGDMSQSFLEACWTELFNETHPCFVDTVQRFSTKRTSNSVKAVKFLPRSLQYTFFDLRFALVTMLNLRSLWKGETRACNGLLIRRSPFNSVVDKKTCIEKTCKFLGKWLRLGKIDSPIYHSSRLYDRVMRLKGRVS
jgi:hypothetical protein